MFIGQSDGSVCEFICICKKTDRNIIPFASHRALFVYLMSFSLRVHTCVCVCAWVYVNFRRVRICPDDVVCATVFYSMANVWLAGCVSVCVNVSVLHYYICVTLFCAFFGSNSVYRIYSIYYGTQRKKRRIKRNSQEKAPTRKQTQKQTHTIIFSAPDFHNH